MNSAPDLNALIAMADHLLLSGQTAEAVEDLEKYAIAFNLWYDNYQTSTKQEKPLNSREELIQLLDRHEKVMEFSESLKSAIPEEMAKLRQKGKGIMAYTDTLPKKISFTKTRKG